MPNYCKACTGKKKFAHYGLKGSGKKEWCATCAKEHGIETTIARDRNRGSAR